MMLQGNMQFLFPFHEKEAKPISSPEWAAVVALHFKIAIVHVPQPA